MFLNLKVLVTQFNFIQQFFQSKDFKKREYIRLRAIIILIPNQFFFWIKLAELILDP